MNQKELKELIDFLIEKDIAEFELERGDVKVRIKRGADHSTVMPNHFVAVPSPVVAAPVAAETPHAAPPATPIAAPPAAQAEESGLHEVKSPIVGTFYSSPSPGASPFVSPGDHVEKGQVICVVEAMKLMNEIECDAAGEVVKCLVTDGQPIEFGQPLFSIRTV